MVDENSPASNTSVLQSLAGATGGVSATLFPKASLVAVWGAAPVLCHTTLSPELIVTGLGV